MTLAETVSIDDLWGGQGGAGKTCHCILLGLHSPLEAMETVCGSLTKLQTCHWVNPAHSVSQRSVGTHRAGPVRITSARCAPQTQAERCVRCMAIQREKQNEQTGQSRACALQHSWKRPRWHAASMGTSRGAVKEALTIHDPECYAAGGKNAGFLWKGNVELPQDRRPRS